MNTYYLFIKQIVDGKMYWSEVTRTKAMNREHAILNMGGWAYLDKEYGKSGWMVKSNQQLIDTAFHRLSWLEKGIV